MISPKALDASDTIETLDDAIQYAVLMHAGQTRRGGRPYIMHPMSVCIKLAEQLHLIDVDLEENDKLNLLSVEHGLMTAIMHDLIEDTGVTIESLSELKVPQDVLVVLEILTKKEDVSYKDYIRKISESKSILSTYIKVLDIFDNVDSFHRGEDHVSDHAKNKYLSALSMLKGSLNSEENKETTD